MGTVRALVIMMAVTATAVGAVAEEPGTLPEQDPVLLRLVERALPYYPDSVFRITEDVRERTPSGSYRRVTVERESRSKFLSGSTTLYVDEIAEELSGRAHVAKVDVDESGDLANRFGIMSIPTLIVFKSGKVVDQLIENRMNR